MDEGGEPKFSGEGNRKHGRAAKEERGVQYFSGRRNMRQAWTREELAKFSGGKSRKHVRAAKRRENHPIFNGRKKMRRAWTREGWQNLAV